MFGNALNSGNSNRIKSASMNNDKSNNNNNNNKFKHVVKRIDSKGMHIAN